MNSFGRLFRMTIFGESHGVAVGLVLDGCPAGLSLTPDDFIADIERRKGGIQKGTTPRQESDLPIFKTGIFNNITTGAPITILFENNNTRSGAYEKFGGFEDYRGGGHFSGRLTVALVAAGVIAKKLLHIVNTEVRAEIKEIAGMEDLEAGLQKAIEAKDSVGGILECRV